MSREYGTRDSDGKEILIRITCDGSGCDAEIKPHPNSGWIRKGTDNGLGSDKLEWYYCPRCSS